MVNQGFFAHESPDGTTFDTRVERFYPSRGFRYWRVAENIAAMTGVMSAEEAVDLWLESPGHRRVIFDPQWREAGLGAVRAASTRLFPGAGRRPRSRSTSASAAPDVCRRSRPARSWLEPLRGELAERGGVGVDLRRETALPTDEDHAVDVDVVHDAAVAGPVVVVEVGHELDRGADRHAGANARGQQLCTICIHGSRYRYSPDRA